MAQARTLIMNPRSIEAAASRGCATRFIQELFTAGIRVARGRAPRAERDGWGLYPKTNSHPP
jgi:hypothetical protein